MKPEVALIVQAAIAGGVLAAAMAGLAMLVGQREVAGETLLLVPAGAVAGATATALMLSSWRRAGGALPDFWGLRSALCIFRPGVPAMFSDTSATPTAIKPSTSAAA